MFNNVLHRNRPAREGVVEERDADGRVVAERVDETDRDMVTDRDVVADRDVVTDRDVVADRPAVVDRPRDTVVDRRGDTVVEPPVARDTVVDEPVTEPVVVDERPPWAHNSVSAVTGLVFGVVAVAAVLTGLLAPVGVAVGVIGTLISLTGLFRASRRGVTGHGAAFIGLVASLGAVVVGVLAIQGELSWLSSDTDQVARLHNWLNDTFPWMKRW